jgi:hypothetical protein
MDYIKGNWSGLAYLSRTRAFIEMMPDGRMRSTNASPFQSKTTWCFGVVYAPTKPKHAKKRFKRPTHRFARKRVWVSHTLLVVSGDWGLCIGTEWAAGIGVSGGRVPDLARLAVERPRKAKLVCQPPIGVRPPS